MNKKQLRQRMEDMLYGANGGYSYDPDVGPMAGLSPEAFFGWISAVMDEFVPEGSCLRKLNCLHKFADFDEAVEAAWDAMPD